MSEIKISSTGWLAISLRNGAAGVFDLNDTCSWQYLKSESIVDQSKDYDDDNTNDLNRNLIKFSPNGQILVINGQNKQLNVYIQSDFEKTEVWWQLQRIIIVKKHSFALDLTNEFLLIADKNGDVYKVDLSFNDNNNLIIKAENCIMKNVSMLLDIAFICINDKQSFILTADQDEKIRLNHYPNTSNIEGYCLGHTEFVSHIKLIDNNHILSASGDG
jgi:tRNA (guanine-N(7)-)-methyltransferase subunit TRM82